MIDVEILDIHVAKPCPRDHVLPSMYIASGWKVVKCPVCGIGACVSLGTMNDAIGTYNKIVEA